MPGFQRTYSDLRDALSWNDHAAINRLLEEGADVNVIGEHHWMTALNMAQDTEWSKENIEKISAMLRAAGASQ